MSREICTGGARFVHVALHIGFSGDKSLSCSEASSFAECMLLQNYRECSVNNFPSHGTVARSSIDRSTSRFVACEGVALVMLYLFITYVPGQVSQSFVNPYKVLQISEDADPKVIKKAYRKLALRCSSRAESQS